jgi:hypothetical protein
MPVPEIGTAVGVPVVLVMGVLGVDGGVLPTLSLRPPGDKGRRPARWLVAVASLTPPRGGGPAVRGGSSPG